MRGRDGRRGGTSRREFLAAGAASVVACGVTGGPLRAAPKTTYTRMNLSDPKAASAISSYKKAITAMLKLPATDPRNWYRNAFIHELDCPHRNWWFLPWHRGYIGWFEQTCRDLSGDSNFALPYWDWTAEPEIPASFTDNSVLNPNNPAFIAGLKAFQDQFTDPVKTFYAGLSPEQLDQLKRRGLATATDFVDQVSGDFFPTAQARQPNFGASLSAAVAIGMIKRALAPNNFLNFGSAKATSHQDMVGENILESQPHDNVHGAVGGFMGQFLSPVDPIFFMHHSNLDRLWDVWTRKQEKLGRATLPTGANLAAWKKEPFLFYVDHSGKPVAKTTAGDYATIGDFGYAYQPGSGEEVIPTRVEVGAAGNKEFAGTLSREYLDFQTPTVAHVNVPEGLMRAATTNDGTELVARITLELPDNPVGMRFHVVVNPPQGARNLRFTEPNFAGTIAPFGRHTHGHKSGPVFFDVPLAGAVKKLHAAEMLRLDQPFQVRVVPDTEGVTLTPFTTPLKSISIISV